MTEPYPSPTTSSPAVDSANTSVGELVSQITDGLSTLLRQELALAKAETKQEVSKATSAGRLLAAAGFAGYVFSIFASFAIAWSLDEVLPRWLAFAVVALVFGLMALVLYRKGRKQLKNVDPTPHQTIATVKEGVRS